MSRKPLVSSANWEKIFDADKVIIYKDSNPDNWEYYKVIITGERPKYFYGELAWSDYRRYVYDKTWLHLQYRL
jgi:hypothetical protein